MKKNNFKIPWYAQPYIIGICFLLFIITQFWLFPILALVSMILYYVKWKKIAKVYKNIGDVDKYCADVKAQTEAYCNGVKYNADKYYADIKNNADKYSTDVRNSADQYCTDVRKQIENDKNVFENELKNKDELIGEKEKQIARLEETISDRKTELEKLNKDITVEESNVYVDYSITSAEYKNKLSVSQLDEKKLIQDELAVKVTSDDAKAVVNANVKQILRCFNSETAAIIKSVTSKNVDTLRNRMIKSFEVLNNIYKYDGVSLTKKNVGIKT